jgi:hypothetical protein
MLLETPVSWKQPSTVVADLQLEHRQSLGVKTAATPWAISAAASESG